MDPSQKLLADYVKNGSEAAFRELVARYINLVHSTATRLVNGDAHLAEDITQTVFANLARKAPRLPANLMIGGWLHRDACLVAGTVMRGERRRYFRERQAVAMNLPEDHTAANLAQVAPILDEAINQLEPDDRTAILLRFFEQREFRAVGEAMGSNEDAARMRVSRALDKLQTLLKNRGVTFSAAALGAALAVGAVSAAPIGLAATVAGTALAAGTTGGFATPLLKFMSISNLKIAAVSVAAVAALAVPVIQHQSLAKLRDENQTLRQQAAQVAPLQEQNQQLSNQVAQARTGPAPATPQVRELARLRNEVATLRDQTNALTQEQTALRQANLGQFVGVRGARRGLAGVGKRAFMNMTMQAFANFIGGFLNAPVADQTGLTGTYDFEITRPALGGPDGMLERITGILKNELGLQLVPFAGPFSAEEQQAGRPPLVVFNPYTGGTITNIVPSQAPDAAGFAIKLDRSEAPGRKPADGQPFADEQMPGPRGVFNADSAIDTTGLPPAVVNKLRLIDASKMQWALEYNKKNSDTPTWQDIQLYLGRGPTGDLNGFTNAPEGEYTIGAVTQPPQFHANPAGLAALQSTDASFRPSDKATDACINNLRLMDSAKQQWALENNKRNKDIPTMQELIKYLGLNAVSPVCPDGGTYTIGMVGEKPTCTIPGHVLP